MKWFAKFLLLAFLVCPSQAFATNWSIVTGQTAHLFSNSGLTVVASALPSTPTVGNVVCVMVEFYDGTTVAPTVSISDENGKTYTNSPNSPSSILSDAGGVFLAYLIVPSGAGQTVTATFSKSSVASGIYVTEFHLASGTIVFDSDATGTGTGTAVNTPTVPVNSSDDLLYAGVMPAHQISTADSPWTVDPAGIDTATKAAAEYLLGASSGTAVAYTQNVSGNWSGAGMSFKASGVTDQTFGFRRRLQQ